MEKLEDDTIMIVIIIIRVLTGIQCSDEQK